MNILAGKKWIFVAVLAVIAVMALVLLLSDGDMLKGAITPAVIQWN